MKSTTALPKSKAKTAYGLSEVRRIILAEPLRYCQASYLVRGNGIKELGLRAPRCGTIGCVAGWVFTLKDREASRVLGLSDDQAIELFRGSAVPGKAQTARHARAGAAHIARFQKLYAQQLKAKAV